MPPETARAGEVSSSGPAARPCPSGAPVAEIERDVEGLLAEGLLIPLPPQARPSNRRLRTTSGRSIPGGVAEPLYTTAAVLEVQERLEKIVQERPDAVFLLAYRSGGRLAALDAIGGLARDPEASVAAVAPGRPAAASFESVTGIETSAFAGGQPTGCTRAGIVVVAEAHRLGPWELSSVVESALASEGRIVLFAPAAALETHVGTAAILAPHLSPLAVGGQAPERSTVPEGGAGVAEEHRFAGRTVVVVTSGPAAREAMLATWHRGRTEGERPLLVASDGAVVGALRDALRDAGGSPDEVVEARRLASGQAHGGPARPIVTLGALPKALEGGPPRGCVQVAIVPPGGDRLERLGRAAEVARPRYLVSELGTIPERASGRAAWRAGAAAIETFRRSWSVDDHERALGDPRVARSLGAAAPADLAATRLVVRDAVRALEAITPTRGRRSLEAHGRSR